MLNSMWSKGSGKMEGIPSLNDDTVSNPFCQKMSKTDSICGSCYSMNMLKTFRKKCRPKFEFVGNYLSEKVRKPNELPICPAHHGRFHSHGELRNETHFINFISICNNQPNTTFTLWTKRFDIVNSVLTHKNKPKNLILIFSNSKVDSVKKRVPMHFDKVFNNVSKKQENINCSGKCSDCMMCYTVGDKTEQIIEQIK